jgi:hypothetical protein
LIDHRGRELVGELAYHRLLAADSLEQIFRRKPIIGGRVVHFRMLLQIFNRFRIDAFRHQNGRFHRTAIVAHARPIVQCGFIS